MKVDRACDNCKYYRVYGQKGQCNHLGHTDWKIPENRVCQLWESEDEIQCFADGICPECGSHTYNPGGLITSPMVCRKCGWESGGKGLSKEALQDIKELFEDMGINSDE